MNRNGLIATLAVCASAVLISGMFRITHAGDLNPPPGPIAESGPTLTEVQAAVLGFQQGTEYAGFYSSGFASSVTWTRVTEGSGVLHDLTMYWGDNDILLLREDGQKQIGAFLASGSGNTTTTRIPLNIRYENGVEVGVRNPGTGNVADGYLLRYTPDP